MANEQQINWLAVHNGAVKKICIISIHINRVLGYRSGDKSKLKLFGTITLRHSMHEIKAKYLAQDFIFRDKLSFVLIKRKATSWWDASGLLYVLNKTKECGLGGSHHLKSETFPES